MLKMLKILILFFLFTLDVFSQSELGCNYNTVDLNKNSTFLINEWKYHYGDIANGANPSLIDTSWEKITRFNFRKDKTGIHWFRTNIKLIGEINFEKEVMIWISKLPSAFEVYWDGKLIGINGKVANSKQEEIPGNYIFYKKLNKNLLTEKNHCLAIRASNFNGELILGRNTSFFTIVGYYSDWFSNYELNINRHYFSVGLLMITSILCFSLFLVVARNMSFLFLGTFCIIEISFHLSYILVNLKLVNITNADYIYFFRNISYFFEGILVNSFLIFKYKIPKKYFHISLIIFVTVISEALFRFQILNIPPHHFILYGYATGMLIYSCYLKKVGSFITFIGVFTLFILNTINIVSINFSLFGLSRLPFFLAEFAYIIFISSIIFSTALQIRKQNQEHEKAKNLSQRLEMELLKRNIKPHFIMNTLFSVISLIRKEPSKAIEMIQALAEEFQIVNKISSKKLIPIEEEIELCCKHLKIMEFRRNAKYRFETFGIDKIEKIPPMIFHTLVENGITHSYKIGENGEFKLHFKRNGKSVQYLFQNGGSKLQSIKSKSNEDIETGTGLNYVKARLNESYGDNWNMKYGLINNYWEVEINIQN